MSIFFKWFSNKETESPKSVEPQKLRLSASDYCEQGQKSMDASRYVEAMEFFQAAIEADKRFEKAYLLLSEVYEKQGKKDKAKAALYALLAIDPNNERALKKFDEIIGKTVAQSQDILSETSVTQTIVSNSNTSSVGNNSNSQQQSNRVGNYRVFDGKPEDAFDFFIIFDDGNRLYFKIQNNQLALISPNNGYGHNGWYWEGFIEPKGELTIPKDVVYKGTRLEVDTIEDSALAKCKELTSVILPDSVKAIREGAFYACRNLKTVVFPNSLLSIGKNAFESCESLSKVELPSLLSIIELGAFRHCDNLEFVTIPSSVKKIGKDTFRPLFPKKELRLIMKGRPPICEGDLGRGRMLVKVPHGTLEAYLTAQYWQCLNIQEET